MNHLKSLKFMALAAVAAGARPCCCADDGVNLALGKAYAFDSAPNYSLCLDKDDAVQLTDGKWQKRPKGAFWTEKATVGWRFGGVGTRLVTLDLGRDEPLKGFAWNYAAGRAGVGWPEFVYVYTSADAKTWRFVGDLLEASAEEHGAPARDGYAVCRAHASTMNCHGRYVAFLVQAQNFIFVDEIEAWKGPDANLKDADDAVTVASPRAHHAAVQSARTLRRDAERLVTAATLLGADDFAAVERELHRINAIVARAKGYRRAFLWPCERWANNSPLDLPQTKGAAAAPVLVEMMRGETRSAAVNLTNPTDADIETTVEAKGFPAEARVELREVGTLIVRTGDRVAGALLPNDAGARLKVRVPSGETRQVWVTFAKPAAAAGAYTGTLVAAGAEKRLTLRLADLDFPARPRLHVGGWDYSECGNGYYGAPGHLRAKMARMREIFTDTPWATRRVMPGGAKFRADGSLANAATLDFTAWRDWTALWGEQARQYCVFVAAGRTFHGEAMGTPRFRRMLGEYARAWHEGVRAELKGRRIVLLLVDEPHEREQDETIVAWARAIKAAAPAFVIYEDVTYRDPSQATKELFEVSEIVCPPCPLMTAAHTEDFFASLGREGKELWLYSCSGPARQLDPVAYYRAQPWHAWKIGAKGTFFWALGCGGGIGDSFRPFAQKGAEYSPFMVSPTDAFRAKQSEAIMESVEDYEYLALLREKIAKARAAGRDVTAAERLLAEAPQRALGEGREGGEGRYSWDRSYDRGAMDRVRVELLQALEACGKQGR